jgi:hypothetical protein
MNVALDRSSLQVMEKGMHPKVAWICCTG